MNSSFVPKSAYFLIWIYIFKLGSSICTSSLFVLLAFVTGLAQTSMQNMSNNSSSIVDDGTEAVVIISPMLTEQYFKMKTDFSILLNNAIDEILETKSLEDIKRIILAIECCDNKERKEVINQAKDKDQLVSLIREYCFLTNLGVLKSFVEQFDMKNTKEKMKKFEDQRDELYEKTLALDFAKKAIEDHPKGSQSEVSIFCFPVFYLHHTFVRLLLKLSGIGKIQHFGSLSNFSLLPLKAVIISLL